ncbi:hypothetical protein L484_009011 [Morus notabilis]|uniref:Uncharacterized protein n=1 Tax=Morus notabilis TaxID=981085 RepID=W9RH79_9ROSA|nr:hypothetical protein L484_009011 [Morus notabilis]
MRGFGLQYLLTLGGKVKITNIRAISRFKVWKDHNLLIHEGKAGERLTVLEGAVSWLMQFQAFHCAVSVVMDRSPLQLR